MEAGVILKIQMLRLLSGMNKTFFSIHLFLEFFTEKLPEEYLPIALKLMRNILYPSFITMTKLPLNIFDIARLVLSK